jgi:hypothetical protein
MLPEPFNPRQIEPALLTFGEYEKIVDPTKKWHPPSAYDFDLKKLQWRKKDQFPKVFRRLRVGGLEFEFRYRTEKLSYAKRDAGGEYLRVDGQIQFWTEEEAKASGFKLVDHSIGVFEGDQCVGVVQDEWGTVLVSVAREYRQFGLGTILQKMARTMYPDKPSGGFTPAGREGFRRVHREFVRDAIRNGLYRSLIKAGALTKDRVQEIFDSAHLDTPRPKPVTTNYGASDPSNWELYVGEYGDFILYDRNLRHLLHGHSERADYFIDRMIIGAVNVRELDTREGKYALLTLFGADRPKIKNFLMYVALSYCANEGFRLLVDDDGDLEAVDPRYGERIGTPNKESGFRRQEVRLKTEPLPYVQMGTKERRFRQSFDRYDEFHDRILELAYSKFRVDPESKTR